MSTKNKFNKILIFLYILFQINRLAIAQDSTSKFVDVFIDGNYSGANKMFSEFYGGNLENYPRLIAPDSILGNNTKYFLSLPTGSFVIYKFTDNVIIDFPNQDDIFITEGGCSGENAKVSVSNNGKIFTDVGLVNDCKTSSIDLANFKYNKAVRYIRIEGLDNGGASPGFDLINIYGLPNSSKSQFFDIDSLPSILARKDSKKTNVLC